ncbi:MAG: HlyC/CorC family transporter [Candidatus Riflebacteria bacterium]|nr:HlyC/CorC family transporter [Candidatus Riflebacteria bacterium]
MAPYIGIIVCILFSAFFSACEIAFSSASKVRLRHKSESGSKAASLALYIIKNFNEALSAILIGNNLVNLSASAISTVIIMELAGESGALISTVLMTVIILIFGEITPKIVAKKVAETYVMIAAFPLRIIMIVLKPATSLVVYLIDKISRFWGKPEEGPTITEDELVTIIESVEADGIIDEDASDLLQSSLEFSEITVSEVVTHRVDLLAIDIEDEMKDIVKAVLTSKYSRIPVYKHTIDDVIGILFVNSFLKALAEGETIDHEKLEQMLMKPRFVYETMKLPEVFKLMNNENLQMAIVNDEYGGTLGCVTLEDVLEELVGEIWDESDDVELGILETNEKNFYEVAGDISIRDFVDYFDLDLSDFDSEYYSIGGWLIEHMDRLPEVGQSSEFQNLKFTVLELDVMRVSKILVEVAEEPEEDNKSGEEYW